MKEIFKDIDHYYHKCSFLLKNSMRVFFLIKVILYKYLIDHKYLNLDDRLRNNFTINKIIEAWSGKYIDYYEEENLILSQEGWEDLLEFIYHSTSLKGINSNILGYFYEYLNNNIEKKNKGLFYTPNDIIAHMISMMDLQEDELPKIIDPACGSGFFLSEIYDTIMEKQSDLSVEEKLSLHKRIIEQQLYGIEKDEIAALVTKLVLNLKQPIFLPVKNITNEDALLGSSINTTFDYVIGNPPYIGHKLLDKDYFISLKEKYSEVFYDKGDLSYCFFKRGLELLHPGGSLLYITSRYFLESLSGNGLRKYIKEHSNINSIIDFNGNRVIKGAKVDLAIIDITKTKNVKTNHAIKVKKLKTNVVLDKYNEIFDNTSNYETFEINQDELRNDGWILCDHISQSILNKISMKCNVTLNDIASSSQGIITGCDKAFVLQENETQNFNKSILKPWIKSTNIEPYSIRPSGRYLLYTDGIEDIAQYPHEIEHVKTYKERLSNRRECRNGIRKWYMLQWGRKKESFEKPKILFPYKAANNKFAIDNNHCYFSADIYSLVLKDNPNNSYTLQFLVCLLNSKLYEFYFKSYAKKLGGKLYEYYPNTLMRLKIPNIDDKMREQFQEYYHTIVAAKTSNSTENLNYNLARIDEDLSNFFDLTNKEKEKIGLELPY